MAGELIVERFRSEIALGATAVFRESPMEVPRQPLGYERRDNCVDIAGGIADCERRARSFGLVAIDAKHGWQYEFDTRQLQVFGAQSLHAPRLCRRRYAAAAVAPRVVAIARPDRIA